MSTVAMPPYPGFPDAAHPGAAGGAPAGGHGGGPGGGDVQVFYACSSTYSSGTPGVLGTGVLATEASQSVSCVPAVVHAR